MAVPGDADDVLTAVRLGWYLAEVRGRNRLDAPEAPGLLMPDRRDHALPLRGERNATELRIEAQAVMAALATRLGVDSGGGTGGLRRRGKFSYPAALEAGARRLAGLTDRAGLTADREWDSFAELIYQFDAHIQDVLSAESDSQACGYQLGRAIAESFWALRRGLPTPGGVPASAGPPGGSTPTDGAGTGGGAGGEAGHSGSWQFLFGNERTQEMSRLLGRLSAYMHPYTAASISGSLRVWNEVAKDTAWRQAAYRDLFPQLRRWYELIVLRQDPTTLIKPYDLAKHFRVTLRAAKVFWVELAVSGLSVVALAGLAWALTQPWVATWFNAILGAVAVLGLSAAGLSASVKNAAQALLTRLRQDAYTDLIAIAVTTVRQPRPGSPPQAARKETEHLVRQRDLTPATPN
jgi:hypothetical protein